MHKIIVTSKIIDIPINIIFLLEDIFADVEQADKETSLFRFLQKLQLLGRGKDGLWVKE